MSEGSESEGFDPRTRIEDGWMPCVGPSVCNALWVDVDVDVDGMFPR